MTTVAQDDALVSVPAWIAATAVGPVLIQHDGQLVAALVSMEDFESVRKAYADRALAAFEGDIAHSAISRVETHAVELGITPEELVDRLLIDRDEF